MHCCHHLTSLQHTTSESQLVNTCLDVDLGFKILRTASQLSGPVPPPVTSIQVIYLSLCKPAKLHLQTAKPFAPTQPLYRLLKKSAGQHLSLVCRHNLVTVYDSLFSNKKYMYLDSSPFLEIYGRLYNPSFSALLKTPSCRFA